MQSNMFAYNGDHDVADINLAVLAVRYFMQKVDSCLSFGAASQRNRGLIDNQAPIRLPYFGNLATPLDFA